MLIDKNGMLTDRLREFLRGNKAVSNPPEHRRRIRNRVRHTFMDFSVLFNHLEQRDFDQILSSNVVSEPGGYVGYVDDDAESVPPELVWGILPVSLPDPMAPNSEPLSVGLGLGGMRQTHAVMYQCLHDGLARPLDLPFVPLIEHTVRDALLDVFMRTGRPFDVRVNIEINEADANLPALYEHYSAGEELSDRELEWLVHARYLSPLKDADDQTQSNT